MNPEKVLTMCTEKSINMRDMPGGGIPDFTICDAKHALGHMREAEFNYCQYVFFLYGDSSLTALTSNTILGIIKRNPGIEKGKDAEIFMKICRMACIEQAKPGGRITHKSRYDSLKLNRNEWRYHWEFVFNHASSYLNELRQGVERHIHLMTNHDL